MLDHDLAELYQIPTKRLKEQGQTQPKAFSQGFHVRTFRSGTYELEVAICDLKFGMGRKSSFTFCIH